jgi:cytochrome c553
MKSQMMVFILFLFLGISCSDNPADSKSNNNAPADHTVSKSGVRHKSGLNNPAANCVECHGSDLKGGTENVSCFSCHGKKW